MIAKVFAAVRAFMIGGQPLINQMKEIAQELHVPDAVDPEVIEEPKVEEKPKRTRKPKVEASTETKPKRKYTKKKKTD